MGKNKRPDDQRLLKRKWVFKIQKNRTNNEQIFKARLMAIGASKKIKQIIMIRTN